MPGRVAALAAIDLTGPDAVGFGQRIFANDVTALADGDWQWNCVLSPQGRVLSLFRLWRQGDQNLSLILPASAQSSTRMLLSRYLLRAKLRITDAERWVVGGDSEIVDAGYPRLVSTDGRWLALAPPGDSGIGDSASLSSAWHAREVAQGIPWIQHDATETFTPQALSLERLNAFSVRKGCYPGQEIVARLHFLGQNKRTLRRFATPETLAPGVPVFAQTPASRVAGSVVTTFPHTAGTDVLVVVQVASADHPLFADEACSVPLHPRALEDPPLPATPTGLAKA